MNYGDALAWLYGTQTFGIKLGLDNTRRLLAAAGDPQDRLRFLHVAGTNGKGSVCAMLDSVLRTAGIRCGLFTSPHLVDFRERIRLAGSEIPADAVAEGLTLLRESSAGCDHAPTFFELTTVLAAWWLAREGADIVVWETGMGGRLDATNVVTPLVSVITPVGLDHQQWLGPTLAAIAAEKAGILKPGVPAVSAPQPDEVRAVLEVRASEIHAPLHFVEGSYDGPLGLRGLHQRRNAALAWATLDAAGLVPDHEVRRRGLASVEWPGRFEAIGRDLVVDGAHNPQATAALVETWQSVFGETKARLVFGALGDKNLAPMLADLRRIADEIWLVSVANPRRAAIGELHPLAVAAGFRKIHDGSLADALAAARSGSPVLVTGSLFLAGEALALLRGQPLPEASAQ